MATDAPTDHVVDATPDQGSDVRGDRPLNDATSDASSCSTIATDYATALHTAQECTVGAANQCALQVRSGFFCQCTTFANRDADVLAALVTEYQNNGCTIVCGGVCVMFRALSCLTDTTSSTGGRCQATNLLNLAATDNGGTFSVAVGDEVDITLESPVPGSYSTTVTLSTENATILEVTIPAGPTNAFGPTRLYRLRAMSGGSAKVQIPFQPSASGSSRPGYSVSFNIH